MTPELLRYRVSGSGPKLVLLHPAGLDMTCWDRVVALLESRFRILCVDLRGHGGSPVASEGMTLAEHAADVHQTLEQAGFTPAAVVGLSVGGMIAQELALDFPGDLTRLVVAGCPCTLPAEARPVLAARGTVALTSGMEAVVAETLERWFTPAFIRQGGADAVRERLLSDDPAGWNSIWHAISQLDTAPRLHRIAVPTLCIAGDLDRSAPPAILEAIATRIPGARMAVLEGAPHMMQVECPDAFAALVRGFLDGVPVED